jgi:Concanavalin A-like lectin/glucanases superfamily/Putative Ig domain
LVSAPAAIPAHQWTHLAATFDGTNKRLYVNGIEVATQTTGLGALIYDPASVPVTIGADWVRDSPAYFFKGWIDEVSLYSRALTRNEIIAIYNADRIGKNIKQPYISSPSQLPDGAVGVAYDYRFTAVLGSAPLSFSLSAGAFPAGITLAPIGHLSGTPALNTPGIWSFTLQVTDATGAFSEQLYTLKISDQVIAPPGLVSWWQAEGNVQDATGANPGLIRQEAAFAAGKVGQAFSFNGTTAYIEVPDSLTLRLTSLTLEAWVTFDSPAGIQVIFDKPVAPNLSASYVLWLESQTLRGVASYKVNPTLSAPFAPQTGRWYHIAYTFDTSTKQQALYIDGTQVAVGNTTQPIGYDNHPLLLGCEIQNGQPKHFLRGKIDEASIYNRTLTAGEIASIYNAGPAGKRLPIV